MNLKEHLQKNFDKQLTHWQWISKSVNAWLEEKRQEMFIDTVSTMDCEMSGVREETFEALIDDLTINVPKTTEDKK